MRFGPSLSRPLHRPRDGQIGFHFRVPTPHD
jgi:hypothetical protein